jgi:ribosome biogenesis protein NSA2
LHYITSADFCAVKNKRNEKAAKFSVPLPKVRGIADEETFKVVKTGKKTAKKGIYNSPS